MMNIGRQFEFICIFFMVHGNERVAVGIKSSAYVCVYVCRERERAVGRAKALERFHIVNLEQPGLRVEVPFRECAENKYPVAVTICSLFKYNIGKCL